VEAVGTDPLVSDITDVDGVYTLPDLEAGLYDIFFSHENYEDMTETGIQVTAGEETILDVALVELPGWITGTVTEALAREPIQGVYVEAVGTDPLVSDITDIDGVYALPDLEAGLYDIFFSHENYEDMTETGIQVTAGEETILDVEMVWIYQPIPTLSEWGMIVLALLVLAIGTAAVIRRQGAVIASK